MSKISTTMMNKKRSSSSNTTNTIITTNNVNKKINKSNYMIDDDSNIKYYNEFNYMSTSSDGYSSGDIQSKTFEKIQLENLQSNEMGSVIRFLMQDDTNTHY